MYILFVVAAAAAVVVAVAYVVLFLRVCHRFTHIRFKRSVHSVIPCEEIPEDVRARLETARPFLESRGFVLHRCFCVTPELELPDAKNTWVLGFRHPETGALASVTPHPLATFACHVEFATCFQNGEIWSTVNGLRHLLLPERSEECVFFDDCLADGRDAWEAHRRRVEASGKMVLMNEQEADERLMRYNEQTIERRVAQGIFKPASVPERWMMTWSAAMRWVRQINMGKRKAGRVKAPVPEERFWQKSAELEASRQSREFFRTTRLSRRDRAILFVGSVVLFAAVGLRLFGAATWALLGMLALHEGGHWLAMKRTGHENLSVFFIPGLGALTAGEKIGATPMEQLLVFLAGPMPGLVLGLVWASLAPRGVSFGVFLSIVFLVAINGLNLLPLFPLDGGRIVDVLLLSRLPRLRFGFVLSGWAVVACAAGASAWYWNDRLMPIFACLMALALPGQWHLLKARLALGPCGGLTEEEARERVFELLQAPRFAKWSAGRRRQVAETLVSEIVRPLPRWKEIGVGMVVYALCLGLPFAAAGRIPLLARLFFRR